MGQASHGKGFGKFSLSETVNKIQRGIQRDEKGQEHRQ